MRIFIFIIYIIFHFRAVGLVYNLGKLLQNVKEGEYRCICKHTLVGDLYIQFAFQKIVLYY